jgi:hypothetical protein
MQLCTICISLSISVLAGVHRSLQLSLLLMLLKESHAATEPQGIPDAAALHDLHLLHGMHHLAGVYHLAGMRLLGGMLVSRLGEASDLRIRSARPRHCLFRREANKRVTARSQ